MDIGIDTNIKVTVTALTNNTSSKLESCGGLPMWLIRPQWPKLGYQFLFSHGETILMKNNQMLSR